ncbi:MAG TPA: hypothetical protein P5307_28440, partial [Pirellulaceae bacterium]|nr:hypothetical protein [Pirellulaceae bacterium]
IIGEDREKQDLANDEIGLTKTPPTGELIGVRREVDPEIPATEIPDANLRRAIELALGKRPDSTFRASELASIGYLSWRMKEFETSIRDLKGLEYLTNLVQLDLLDGVRGTNNKPPSLVPITPRRALAPHPLVGEEIGTSRLRVLNLGTTISGVWEGVAQLPKTLQKLRIPHAVRKEVLGSQFAGFDELDELRVDDGILNQAPNSVVSESAGKNGPAIFASDEFGEFGIIRNVPPTVTLPAEITGVKEGTTRSAADLLAGVTVSDPADTVISYATVLDPFGNRTPLYDNALKFDAGAQAIVIPTTSDFASPIFTVEMNVRIDTSANGLLPLLSFDGQSLQWMIEGSATQRRLSGILQGTELVASGNQSPRPIASSQRVSEMLPFSVGVWSHLAISFDGTKLRLYQNGSLLGETTVGSGFDFKP